jgi:hypothetical protein
LAFNKELALVFVLGQAPISKPWVDSLLTFLVFHCALALSHLLMFFNQSVSFSFLVVVQKAKLKVVDLLFSVEIDPIENESVVRHRQINTHFTHTKDKLAEVKRAIKVFVESSESFSESFKLLEDPIIHVLKEHVDSSVFLHRLHHGQSLERIRKVS